jgi:putative acetyltransferase
VPASLPSVIIRQAVSATDLSRARRLLEAYGNEFGGEDLKAEGFATEMETLPGCYAPPEGRLLLAYDGSKAVGCIAMRRVNQSIAEMKRLYVSPEYRGRGVGSTLVDALLGEARASYARLVLDTRTAMHRAVALYRAKGFVQVAAPRHADPVEGALFFEAAWTS